jgi:hypothetical protein
MVELRSWCLVISGRAGGPGVAGHSDKNQSLLLDFGTGNVSGRERLLAKPPLSGSQGSSFDKSLPLGLSTGRHTLQKSSKHWFIN